MAQGEAGVVVPDKGYLAGAKAMLAARGALLIADEVQTGGGRTGALLACHHDPVRPDILILGKVRPPPPSPHCSGSRCDV